MESTWKMQVESSHKNRIDMEKNCQNAVIKIESMWKTRKECRHKNRKHGQNEFIKTENTDRMQSQKWKTWTECIHKNGKQGQNAVIKIESTWKSQAEFNHKNGINMGKNRWIPFIKMESMWKMWKIQSNQKIIIINGINVESGHKNVIIMEKKLSESSHKNGIDMEKTERIQS